MGISLDTGYHSPRATAIWIRVLAVIGVILLCERTLTYWVWTYHPDHPFSAIGNFGINTTHYSDAAQSPTPGLSKSIIVASVSREHTQWINRNFPDWDINTYVVDDDKANLTVLQNAGHESSVYLTYLINHYWNLPDVMVFLHAQRYQWHNDDPMYDGIPPVKNLRLEHVMQEGYVSLRAAQDPGCPLGLEPDAKKEDGFWDIQNTYAKAFKLFFPKARIPRKVSAPCCAQFAISREAAHLRSPAEYERMRQWLWKTDVVGGKSGRVFEYMWHIIFGKPAVYCPSADVSYCKAFGHCDLKCPAAPLRCQGRYKLPAWTSPLNKAWPRRGQGIDGYPVDKWWEEFYPLDEYDEGFKLRNGSRSATDLFPDSVFPAR